MQNRVYVRYIYIYGLYVCPLNACAGNFIILNRVSYRIFSLGGGEFSVKFSQKFIIWPKFY